MKTITNRITMLIIMFLIAGSAAMAQQSNESQKSKTPPELKTYLIEREVPGAGKLTPEQLKGISQVSCGVLKEMGPKIQWIHSYVTGNKIFCIYKAENEELVKEHAKKGGFPANNIIQVGTIINPATAE